MQEVEGSTPTGGTCPNNFSDPIDQDIRTQWALSWKIVVSEWKSVIAVSLNVRGGVRLIKPANLYMCTQNIKHTTKTDTRRQVCAAMVLYRWAPREMPLRELEHTHTHMQTCHWTNHIKTRGPWWPWVAHPSIIGTKLFQNLSTGLAEEVV